MPRGAERQNGSKQVAAEPDGTLAGFGVTIEGRGLGWWGALEKTLLPWRLAAGGATQILVDSHGSIPSDLRLEAEETWQSDWQKAIGLENWHSDWRTATQAVRGDDIATIPVMGGSTFHRTLLASLVAFHALGACGGEVDRDHAG